MSHWNNMITVLLIISIVTSINVLAQVELRDTTITWQHHQFELNEDNSIKTFSTSDTDIQEVIFPNAKVIENEYIRLVLIPEYGGRILSFFYKPTNHEYLYQSECGSAYGIGDGNFYYDWLMVYGGIFPTFPEPEHGKTWMLPWNFSIIKSNDDTVTVRMEYQDNTAYSNAPGQFNNGITNITCQVDVSVYKNSTQWDYDLTLINNESMNLNYEYWTCTTLAPGSEIGNTGTPLNSEIVIPVDEYFAGWSPGGWIGGYDNYYDFASINNFSEWNDMGIAYASNLQDQFWGVINHNNEEGVFRVSNNTTTFGTKIWTWGKNNIDNNLYDFSNGGADNYIELWAGVSRSFFTDAVLTPNETKTWKESYGATVGMSSVSNMNNIAGLNLIWNKEEKNLTYQVNTYQALDEYTAQISIDGEREPSLDDAAIPFSPLGYTETISFEAMNLANGEHLLTFELVNADGTVVLAADEIIDVETVLGFEQASLNSDELNVRSLSNSEILLTLSDNQLYNVNVMNLNGQEILRDQFSGSSTTLSLPGSGIYIIRVYSNRDLYHKKIYLR